ncbi:GxxExxY protein [Ignavibacteriales bacterium]
MFYEELSKEIIGAFFKVHSTLGFGFLEKVYENALAFELRKLNLDAEQQVLIKVYYDNIIVGNYVADIVVNDLIILELKAGESILPEHEAQLLNYLKATDYEVGYILNFGKKATFNRKVFENERKHPRNSV